MDLILETDKRKEEVKNLQLLLSFKKGTVVMKNTPGEYESWSHLSSYKKDTKDGDFEWVRAEAVIIVESLHNLDHGQDAKSINKYSEGLFSSKVCGSSSYDHSEYYSCIFVLVPIATKENIVEVLNKIRKYCPEFKAEYTEVKTEIL